MNAEMTQQVFYILYKKKLMNENVLDLVERKVKGKAKNISWVSRRIFLLCFEYQLPGLQSYRLMINKITVRLIVFGKLLFKHPYISGETTDHDNQSGGKTLIQMNVAEKMLQYETRKKNNLSNY